MTISSLIRVTFLGLAYFASQAELSADNFTYDDSGRLLSADAAAGLNNSYGYDNESSLLSVTHTGTGGAIPDWWENYYLGTTGVDPTAQPGSDGLSYLMKYSLGLNPLVSTAGRPVSASYPTYADGLVYPTFKYAQSIDGGSLLTLQQSSDNVNWASGSLYFVQVGTAVDLGNGTQLVEFRCTTPMPAASSLYFRLYASVGTPAITSTFNLGQLATGVPAAPRWALVLLALLIPLLASRYLRPRVRA